MNRLQQEQRRLYGPPADANQAQAFEAGGVVDAQGRVRVAVLALARPADWAALAPVWGGVQTDLALPAPAIAVNGVDGFQLWFSFQEPVAAAQAEAWLEALRRRYLPEAARTRVAMFPRGDRALVQPLVPVPLVPALQANGLVWSAFVAQDLAPVFTDEPWLDMPPNPEGQAQLLAALKSIPPAALEEAMQRLQSAAPPVPPVQAAALVAPAAAALEPKRFLLEVMNNPHLDWALRIEAAKALLPYGEAAGG